MTRTLVTHGEVYSEVAEASGDDETDPAYPHRHRPATDYGRPNTLRSNVCFCPNADMGECAENVRFRDESRHCMHARWCRFWPTDASPTCAKNISCNTASGEWACR